MRLLFLKMAPGDLTMSTPVHSTTEAALDIAVTALNLALATDFLFILPVSGGQGWISFKVERAA